MWPFTKTPKTPNQPAPTKSRRIRPIYAIRRYGGGILDRLNGKPASNLSANAEIYTSLATLRSRSRQLIRDNAFAKKYLHMIESNVVGTKGIVLQARTKQADGQPDTLDNEQLERAWREWGQPENCTVGKDLSWIDVQNLCMRAVAGDGEVLIQLVTAYNNPFGFALQIFEADHLDENHNEILKNNRIIMGVEVNKWGAPVAYHLATNHPGDDTYLHN